MGDAEDYITYELTLTANSKNKQLYMVITIICCHLLKYLFPGYSQLIFIHTII
jgi:hypothetical protein